MSVSPLESLLSFARDAAVCVPAAALAVVPVGNELIKKSALQRGEKVLKVAALQALRNGLPMAPTVGIIVGTQMGLERTIKNSCFPVESFSSDLKSAACMGMLSSPLLAVFNGQSLGFSVKESIRRFSRRQLAAITLQETAFVAGLTAAARLEAVMKAQLGDNKLVGYGSAFFAGAAGSLVGHGANTALTRWQAGMVVHPRHLLLGAMTKAHAIGWFAVFYKAGKAAITETVSYLK